MRRSILSLVMVVLLLSSASSPVGTAVAAEKGDCSNLDDFVMFLTLGAVNAEDCSRAAYEEAAIEDMKESDANQTKVDIYTAGTGLKSGHEAWSAPYDNYLNDTNSVAWMKVEKAVAQAYQNGSTKAEAKVAATEAIEDYYAVKQINLIEQWNSSISQAYTLKQQAEMEDGINDTFVWSPNTGQHGSDWPGHINGTLTHSLPLANGTNHDVVGPNIDWGNSLDDPVITPASGTVSLNDGYEVSESIKIRSPNSNYDRLEVIRYNNYKERWDKIDDLHTQLQTEADAFVDATWSDFDSGTINATDVVSSHTAMFEYGIRSGNESEGLYQSTAALALMGFDTPNMTSSGTMTVAYDGQNHTGLVLAENAPGGEWTVGTYDTANISGPVMMATTEGTKIDLTGTFEITAMTAKDGSQVNSTQTTKYVYQTANTNETLELQQQLVDLRQEIEDRESTGGGSDGSSPFGEKQIAAVVIALIAAAMIFRGDSE